jgi:hypothetical protein
LARYLNIKLLNSVFTINSNIMKRYIILSALLVLALSLSAQTTNPGRTKRETKSSGTAVKETRTTKENKKDAVKQDKPENKSEGTIRNQPSRTRESGTRTTTTTRTRTTTSEDKSKSYNTPGRTRQTTVPRDAQNNGQKVTPDRGNTNRESGNSSYRPQRTTSRENNAVRDNGASSSGTRTVNRSSSSADRRVYVPKNEQEYTEKRRTYVTPERRVAVRVAPSTNYVHRPIEYRRSYSPYRVPSRPDIIWDVHIYNHYRYLYPNYDYWYYPVGYRVHTVSAYDAENYIGEFARIYGKVYDVWYSAETGEYYLYIGEPYPYQDFTIILSYRDARRFNRRPERFFSGKDIAVTGVVSVFEGKPEMVIKRKSQVDLYF